MEKETLLDYLDDFYEALQNQLVEDQERWGDTWKHLGKDGQETRIFTRYGDYWNAYLEQNVSVPWLKIAGLAMIAWIRDNNPEIWDKE